MFLSQKSCAVLFSILTIFSTSLIHSWGYAQLGDPVAFDAPKKTTVYQGGALVELGEFSVVENAGVENVVLPLDITDNSGISGERAAFENIVQLYSSENDVWLGDLDNSYFDPARELVGFKPWILDSLENFSLLTAIQNPIQIITAQLDSNPLPDLLVRFAVDYSNSVVDPNPGQLGPENIVAYNQVHRIAVLYNLDAQGTSDRAAILPLRNRISTDPLLRYCPDNYVDEVPGVVPFYRNGSYYYDVGSADVDQDGDDDVIAVNACGDVLSWSNSPDDLITPFGVPEAIFSLNYPLASAQLNAGQFDFDNGGADRPINADQIVLAAEIIFNPDGIDPEIIHLRRDAVPGNSYERFGTIGIAGFCGFVDMTRGDLDGDTIENDFVIPCGDTLYVVHGTELVQSIDLGADISSLDLGDFNNDGQLDIAVADYDNVVIKVGRGNANGCFESNLCDAADLASFQEIALRDDQGGGFINSVRPGFLRVHDFNDDALSDISYVLKEPSVSEFNVLTNAFIVEEPDVVEIGECSATEYAGYENQLIQVCGPSVTINGETAIQFENLSISRLGANNLNAPAAVVVRLIPATNCAELRLPVFPMEASATEIEGSYLFTSSIEIEGGSQELNCNVSIRTQLRQIQGGTAFAKGCSLSSGLVTHVDKYFSLFILIALSTMIILRSYKIKLG